MLRSVGYEVRTFASGELFIAALGDAALIGCVVLELRMPGMTGFEVQEALSRARNPAAVVFLTAHGDVASSVRAMKAGAVDFLIKPFGASELIVAVEGAIAHSRRLAVARAERESIVERFLLLTRREKQVLEQMLLGKRNKQIATELGAAERTVKVHRARVHQKMSASSVAELAGWIERTGLRRYLASGTAEPTASPGAGDGKKFSRHLR